MMWLWGFIYFWGALFVVTSIYLAFVGRDAAIKEVHNVGEQD